MWSTSYDKNHFAIIKSFRKRGAVVKDYANIGGGHPDLLVKVGIVSAYVEVKSGKGQLSPRQHKWWSLHQNWLKFIARSDADVEQIVQELKDLQNSFGTNEIL